MRQESTEKSPSPEPAPASQPQLPGLIQRPMIWTLSSGASSFGPNPFGPFFPLRAGDFHSLQLPTPVPSLWSGSANGLAGCGGWEESPWFFSTVLCSGGILTMAVMGGRPPLLQAALVPRLQQTFQASSCSFTLGHSSVNRPFINTLLTASQLSVSCLVPSGPLCPPTRSLVLMSLGHLALSTVIPLAVCGV